MFAHVLWMQPIPTAQDQCQSSSVRQDTTARPVLTLLPNLQLSRVL